MSVGVLSADACFSAFVFPVVCVKRPAVYAIGSLVIPGSVYNSRPLWTFSLINLWGEDYFSSSFGSWIQCPHLSGRDTILGRETKTP